MIKNYNLQAFCSARVVQRAVKRFIAAGCFALTFVVVTSTAQVGQALPQQTSRPHAGHDQHPHATTPVGQQQQQATVARPEIPDVELLDQDGRRVRFYTDLVQGKMVAINFMFTSCTSYCPGLGRHFGQLQELLGAQLGRDVHLISVSTDPLRDTPERLREWGARFGRRSGWTIVTGERAEVDRLLLALTGVARTGVEPKHTPLLLMANDVRGEWRSAFGMAPAERVRQTLTNW